MSPLQYTNESNDGRDISNSSDTKDSRDISDSSDTSDSIVSSDKRNLFSNQNNFFTIKPNFQKQKIIIYFIDKKI